MWVQGVALRLVGVPNMSVVAKQNEIYLSGSGTLSVVNVVVDSMY